MSIQCGKVLGYDNILGTYDDIILGYTTLGAADRNTIGIDGGTDLCYPYGFGLLDGKELGWFVGISYRSKNLPHSEQTFSGLYMVIELNQSSYSS